jgi:hypothetical protein
MPAMIDLESAFKVYFDEMDRCVDGKCYWALLHLVVVLPDICSALEAGNGEASGKQYKVWANRYLADSVISADEWYEIRCVVLHQGQTLGKTGRYRAYSFSQPNPTEGIIHRVIAKRGNIQDLHLDVGELAKQMTTAMRKWFQDLEADKNSLHSRNVDRNIHSLASTERPQSHDVPVILGWTIHRSHTTSSS